ncbi:hypothetical protein PHMEG_00015810 [Phytophthora megakarya]|uniref:Uncharacterized protein n=1 Tax=Phytophthora megakarya TaxID=4795 RepID=A0A225W1E4_9STRA|nr:hypothetical protein PHMEG_00015810 [Phytophthora megakarya]
MTDSNIERQLLRLHVLLGDDESQLDDVYQRFLKSDPKRTGSLKSTEELKSALEDLLSPKDLKRIDFDNLADRFSSSDGGFDYMAFCKALQRPPQLQSESRRSGSQSPTKRRVRSPTKQQRMRIDKRLESQRLIMETVRNKLLRGIQDGDSDGYKGILNILHRLDTDGSGHVNVDIFTKKIVQRLNCPLTRAERE